MQRRTLLQAGAFALTPLAALAQADDPAKPVTVVVSFTC